MKFVYTKTSDALYIEVGPGRPVARTVELDPGTLVDVDQLGNVVGIEVLRPARDWPLDELLDRFALPAEQVDLLRAMWRRNGDPAPRYYPFTDEESGRLTAA